MDNEKHKTEWYVLQNQFDSYEKHSLYIKLAAILVVFLAGILASISSFIAVILIVLWLQDAIWKTFQSRLETRLLKIEYAISSGAEGDVLQFNSGYQRERLNGLLLISEYARQSIRPTVAFPYVVLILIVLLQAVFF